LEDFIIYRYMDLLFALFGVDLYFATCFWKIFTAHPKVSSTYFLSSWRATNRVPPPAAAALERILKMNALTNSRSTRSPLKMDPQKKDEDNHLSPMGVPLLRRTNTGAPLPSQERARVRRRRNGKLETAFD
jgi:hypothetical protein